MTFHLVACAAILSAQISYAQADQPSATLSAAEIMQRVAANQDRLVKDRTGFVYDQTVHVTTRHRNGKLISEQTTRYTVAPTEKASERTLVSTEGRYLEKGKFVSFEKDLPEDGGTLDTNMAREFRDDLAASDGRDGLAQDLFPLTSSEQQNLEFELEGERTVGGRLAYLIRFRPKDHSDIGWAGEATIDKQEFQPVTVYTKLSKKLPFFVRTMLGTDVPGLGFTTQYTRVANGIWFPSSFGTEFRVNALYFFHRVITLSMQNTNFRHTGVESDIHYGEVADAEPKPGPN